MESKNASRSQLSLKSNRRKARSEPSSRKTAKAKKSLPQPDTSNTPDNKQVPSLYKKVLTVNATTVLHNSTPQLLQRNEVKSLLPEESHLETSHSDTSTNNSSLGKSPARRQSRDEYHFHCSFDDENDEENIKCDIPATQQVTPERILEGVTAFIEVRSNSENRFEGISKQMRTLGATVTKKFTADVTHVIFKDGKKSTREKALKKGIHLVSVLWVESCRVECKRVSEDLFPVISPDESHTPLVVGRLKRTKSMQPKTFEEDVRNSAERGKRKRRKLVEEQKKTPISTLYVQETQEPFSPNLVGPSPSLQLVPDTPTRPENNSDTESVASEITSKRLQFDDEGPDEDKSNAEAVLKTTKDKNGKTHRRKYKVKDTAPTMGRKHKLLSKQQNQSLVQQDIPDMSSSVQRDVLLTGSGGFKRKKMKSSGSSEDTDNLKDKKKAKTIKGSINETLADQLEDEDSKNVAEESSKSVSSELGNSSCAENNSKSFTGKVPNKGKKRVERQSKKKPKKAKSSSHGVDKDADEWTDCSDSGVSIDGFNSSSTKNAKNEDNEGKIKFQRTVKVLSENKSSTDEESTEEENIQNEEGKRKGTKPLRKMGKRTASKVKPKQSIVMTSMHFGEQDIVLSVVRKLGGFYITDKVCQSTTHVISGSARRTLNVLMAIAQGCWLVSSEWAMKSLEAGYWVDEEPYELHEDFPSAQLCRLERASSGAEYQQDLFKDCPLMFISEDTSPQPDALMTLIIKCGGKISTSVRKAGICVGSITRRIQGINVSERWVLDSITEHAALPFNAYALNSPAKQKQASPSY